MKPDGIGGKTARAAGWAGLSMAGAKGITLIGLALLAHVLAPRDFGLLTFAMVYMTYVETLGDLGIGAALVYWPDRREEATQTAFVVNALTGLMWFGVTVVLAPYVASFFHSPHGEPIIRALALTFLFKYLGNTHDHIAQKELNFRARLIPELGLVTVKSALSLALALAGFGVWSLVWGHIAGMAAWTILLWRAVPWRPSWSFPRELVKPMWRYGRSIVAVNILSAIIYKTDLTVVGRTVGATALGLYQMATKIPEASITMLLWVISKVIFPAFSRLHADGRDLKEPYLRVTRAVSVFTAPAAIGLICLAHPLVLVVFGRNWEGAAPMLAALAAYAAARSLGTHAGDVLKATGRAHLLAGIAAIRAAVVVPAVFIGAAYGAVGVARSVAIAGFLTTGISLLITTRVIGVSMGDIAKAVSPSFLAGAAMAAVIVAWTHVVTVPQLVLLAGGGILGALAYMLALRLLDPELLVWARDLIAMQRQSDQAPMGRSE